MYSEIQKKDIAIASIILAGGEGTRLFPLTKNHSKPAVCYGGRYKLIDIPISNSLNSDIRHIFVIGQYLTAELQHHLAQTYHFDQFLPGMIDFLTPEETETHEKIWFEGTADAIRKNLNTIYKIPADYFLVLSGDQLYNINFHEMLELTIAADSDLTIASLPVKESDAKRFGVLKINESAHVIDFVEKPQEQALLDKFALPDSFFQKNGKHENNLSHLCSMGIYIFKREALKRILEEDGRADFGKHLIPTEIKKGKTIAYLYNGYWEDIGTIASFYEANMALTETPSQGLKTYDETNPIFTQVSHLPGTKIIGTRVSKSILCEGCVIEAEEITKSIIGLRSFVKKGTIIRNSIVTGNSFYIAPSHLTTTLPEKFEIGENCLIEKAIIDEHVLIGNNVKLVNKGHLTTYDSDGLYVRDGIIVITAGAKIPDNFEF